jgi:glucosamine--fructose-6-phosphate aminotransferase (isomerizing)
MNVNTISGQSVTAAYAAECTEQAPRLGELLNAYAHDPAIRAEIAEFKKYTPLDRPVLWVGMGASHCSAVSGAGHLTMLGKSSFPVEAAEWLHFSLPAAAHCGRPILITTSGESAEIVEICNRDLPDPRILLCNEPGSTCWLASQIRLPIFAGPEIGNATKSFINSSAACVVLASELAGHPWQEEGRIVTAAFGRAFEQIFERRHEFEEFCRKSANVEIIARGAAFGGAAMGALCIREMSSIRAVAHLGGSFRHGPLLDVDATHTAIIFAAGRTAELGVRLAQDCVARGGRVVLIEATEREAEDRLLPVRIDPVPEAWEALLSVLVPEALTLAMIEGHGTNYVRLATTVE